MSERPRPEVAANDRPVRSLKADATRERAIAALLSERSLAAAAKRAGVGERTIRRWLTDDMDFRADLVQARRAIFEAGVERAQALTVMRAVGETVVDPSGAAGLIRCPQAARPGSPVPLGPGADRSCDGRELNGP